jgi:hypothetical protein
MSALSSCRGASSCKSNCSRLSTVRRLQPNGRAATRREKHATERELAAGLKVQAAADREQTALELADQAKKVVAATKA